MSQPRKRSPRRFRFISPTAVRQLAKILHRRVGRSYLAYLDGVVQSIVESDCMMLRGRVTLNRADAEAAAVLRRATRRR